MRFQKSQFLVNNYKKKCVVKFIQISISYKSINNINDKILKEIIIDLI